MEKRISVLYLTDNNYAPYAGVSITSLFENNKHFDSIKVYVIDDSIAQDNKDKMLNLAKQYNREIVFLDMTAGINTLIKLGAPKYRNTYTTYLKLFAFGIIPVEEKRVFFIDSDSVVVGKIDDILDVDLNGQAVGACKDTIYTKELAGIDGITDGKPYFNMGVMLVDLVKWKEKKCEEKVIELIKHRKTFFAVDQDILNTIEKDNIVPLHPKFNVTAHVHNYSYKGNAKSFPQKEYYSKEEYYEARKNPVIHHFERYIGQQPWIKHNVHPFTKEYDYYLSLSPWKGLEKITKKYTFTFKVEIFLYRILPHDMFLKIYALFFKRYVKKTLNYLESGGKSIT